MESMVSATGLAKRYELGKDNYVDALQGVTVEVEAGEMVAIMGPSGCGKSTLLHVLGCLDSADAGEIWLNGRRIDQLGNGAVTKINQCPLPAFAGWSRRPFRRHPKAAVRPTAKHPRQFGGTAT